MPIGFSDLLKTTAQLDNNLTKGIVSTDDTFGGIRSKIDDWTDLHTSTYNGGSGYTFQDDGTGAAPGHFKAYSTMFYVADGRALVETNTAEGAIRLNSSGEFVSAGGQLYTHGAGTPEPEYWVLSDPTQVGGSGSGTDKLPKFTITGTQGGGSTALPAGYQKLQVLTNAVADPGGSGFNTVIGVDTDLTTTGAQVIDTISLTDGVVDATITTRNLTLGNLGYTGATDANNYSHPTHPGDDIDIDTTALTGATVISDLDINITTDTEGHVTDANGTVSTRDLTLSDLGFTGDTNAQANVGTDLAIGTNNGTTQQVTSSTGNNVDLVVASATKAGIVTNTAQTFAGNKTFNNNLIVGGNLTVSGNFVQANSTVVDFEDAVLALGVPRDGNNDITNGTSSTDTGLNFVKVTAGNAITQFAALRYDISEDKFKFTRHADGGDFTEGGSGVNGGADNVAALKFTHSDTVSQTDQNDTATTMPVDEFANAAAVRSLGAVAKCSIEITTAAVDGDSGSGTANTNFAPDIMGASGYVIKHNLGTQSVFVVAIKTHNSSGSALADPVPVFCKYVPESNDVIRVTVGVTAADEKYDIIVIG